MPARQVIQMQHHVQLKPTFATACTITRVIRSANVKAAVAEGIRKVWIMKQLDFPILVTTLIQ